MIKTIEQYAQCALNELQFKWDRDATWRELSAVQVLNVPEKVADCVEVCGGVFLQVAHIEK